MSNTSRLSLTLALRDYAHIAPNASMGGASGLGDYSFLGLNAAVRQCVVIGSRSIIGAGAVVVHDIPDYVVAFGVPALVQRLIEKQEIRQ